MANANTNLMSFNPIRPTDSTRTTARTKPAVTSREKTGVRKFQSSEKSSSQKNFGAELDKANAHINQSQQNNGEVQTAGNVDAESKAEVVKASTQGQSNTKQDAPQDQNQTQSLSADETQPVTGKIIDNAVTEVILNQPTADVTITADTTQNLNQLVNENVDVEGVETVPQNIFVDVDENITSAIPTDIPKATVSAAENLSSIPANLNEEIPLVNADNLVDVADEVQNLATSADMAVYFTATPETLLTAKIPDSNVDTNNLMSIMPQARDDKAQSMLNFLSGRTWQSPSQNAETPTLQPVEQPQEIPAQLQQTVTSALPLQPQFQSRQLNFKSINQTHAQSQLQSTPLAQQLNQIQMPLNQVQPTVQAQVQTPLTSTPQVDLPVQSQLNQPTVQAPLTSTAPQVDLPVQSQLNQPTLQTPLTSTAPQIDLPIQSQLNQQTVQAPLTSTAPQVDLPIQNQLNQPTTAAQIQQPLTSTAPQIDLPVQSQLNQPTTAAQVQPLQVDAPKVDLPVQSQFNQPTLQAQVQTPLTSTAPQVQQQQFGGEIQPQVNSFQAQVDTKTVNRQAVNEVLGVEMQVEEQPVTPLTPLQNLSRQFNQNQQSMQNFGQPTALNVEVEQQAAEQSVAGNDNFTAHLASVNNTTQNQPTAQVQAPEMTQAPREDFNVPTQIVEQARMIRTAGNTEMVINLKPEHLGQLTLRVSVSTNGAVTASFYTDNAQVRAIIENTMVQLKQELSEQGIKVDNVEVYAGLNEDSLLNGQGQQAWQQNQNQRNRRGQVDMNVVEDELDALNPVSDNESADGVDYKV